MSETRAEHVAVFFYGLFMDEALLASRGIVPSSAAQGHVDGYGLRIGRRATLVPDTAGRAYGVVMTLRAEDVKALYSGQGLADYVSESVSVALPDGSRAPALCFNLPEGQIAGTNPEYARALLALARKLGLPESYLRQIEAMAT